MHIECRDPEAKPFYAAHSSAGGNSFSMSPSPPLNPTTGSNPANRLASIKGHMDGNNPTVFTSDHVPQAPEDPLFGLMAAYRKDTFDKKVDLGIGAYRDNNAKPWVLPVVKQVSNILKPTTITAN